MISWFKALWNRFNPFDLDKVIERQFMRFENMERKLESLHMAVARDVALLENQLAEKELILQQFVNIMPDMVWMKEYDDKGNGGKYIYANQAIRDQLLLCPNPIGHTDVELATRAKQVYGVDNHTFGEKCANSDLITIENYFNKRPKEENRFLESGKVKGQMMYLEVFKDVLVIDGKVVGVCGSGRIMTEYIEAVRTLGAHNCDDVCCLDVRKALSIFKKYEYGEEQ